MKKLSREQLARMTPESRERYLSKLKKVKRNRKILASLIVLVVVAVVGAALSMTVLFNITSIKVTKVGNHYSEKEIRSASGLDIGDNMIRTDFIAAQERIQANLPYVLKATITKNMSGNVTIAVTDDKPAMIIKLKSGHALADADGKVLELLGEIPESSKYMKLKTKGELSANPGEHITFADESEKELFNNVCGGLKSSELYGHITYLDISEPANVKVIYENRIRIKVGDSSDITRKLTAAAKAINMENENGTDTVAEINATIINKVYVNPLESLGEDELDRQSVGNEDDQTEDGASESADEDEESTDKDAEDENGYDDENEDEGDENTENGDENEENAEEWE